MTPDLVVIDEPEFDNSEVEVQSQEDILFEQLIADIQIEDSYEWYKKALMQISDIRKKIEGKMPRYVDKIKAGIREGRNRKRLRDLYAQVEKVSIMRYQILQEAWKDYPTEVENDPELPRWLSNSLDFFEEEREQSKAKLWVKFDEFIKTILPPNK